mmetsp:Transcript_58367/g.104868  ORF Transcript_58367/g.104868 Transcript_58367/m.104868 type:complete len:654 (-) Transcript_58367:23-1984(-)
MLRHWTSWIVAASCVACLSATDDAPIVETTSGLVRGVVQRGRQVFRGIPFAAPPTGDLRFRPPAPHAGWTEVLDATDFGAACLQSPGGCWESSNVTIQSEDCLSLNVMTPASAKRGDNIPVMVYIHAGEFRCGCSNDAESNRPSFGDDVIYISFNFRIGALGFLADDVLRARDRENSTGNYGLLDQRFALMWVQENVAAFGGDPSAVSIFGESSGGTSVAFHLLAAGRGQGQPFQRAILQSPGLTQVKSWKDSASNTEYALAVLAASGSPGCPVSSGYASFEDDVLYNKVLRTVNNSTSQSAAEAWCSGNTRCSGFMISRETTSFVSGAAFIYDVQAQGSKSSTTFLKHGPVHADDRLRCLLGADAKMLTSLTQSVPRDDSFYTDGWAPVVDGAALPVSLVQQVAQGHVPPGVDIMIGSNLDEGTEFMMLAPKLACNATQADFKIWVEDFVGGQPDADEKVLKLYDPRNLTRPLPDCQGRSYYGPPARKYSGEQASYFNAAMRVAGDASVVCPVYSLADAAKGRVFVYDFKLTPSYSVNFGDTSTMGAFHGAEVPFVFGADFELITKAERQLSSAISCFWKSFARHGDPGTAGCAGGASWPAFKALDSIVMKLDASLGSAPLASIARERCRVAQEMRQTHVHELPDDTDTVII